MPKICSQLSKSGKKDVKISLRENALTVRGEGKEEKESKKEDYCCCERVHGSHSLTIALPVEIDKIKAKEIEIEPE